MIYEYAVDPELVVRWADSDRDYSDFVKAFGIGTTRVLSGVPRPNRWRRNVLRMIPESRRDSRFARRVDELASVISRLAIRRPEHVYDGDCGWLSNAIIEHDRMSFDHLFVKCKSDRVCEEAFCQEDIYRADEHCWGNPMELTVHRTTSDLAAAVQNMLRLASEIVFADPWLQTTPDKIDPLVAHIKSAHDNRVTSDLPSIRLVYNVEKVTTQPKSLHDHLRRRLGPEFASTRLEVFAVKPVAGGAGFHNRYLLTDIGGVKFPWSLEQGDAGTEDDINVVAASVYDLRWAQFRNFRAIQIISQFPI